MNDTTSTSTPSSGPAAGAVPGLRAVWNRSPASARVALFAVGYALLAAICLLATPKSAVFAPVWLPAGLVLAALLRTERSGWPVLLTTGFLVQVGVELAIHRTLESALILGLAGSTEALLGAVIARLWLTSQKDDRAINAVMLLSICTLPAPALAGAIGATALTLQPHWGDFVETWLGLWTRDLLGILAVIPLATEVLGGWAAWWRDVARPRRAEGVVLLVSVVGATASTIGLIAVLGPQAKFLLAPIFLWAAMRFHVKGSSLATALLPLATFLFAALLGGEHRLLDGATILLLQLFFGVFAATGLVIAISWTEYLHSADSFAKLRASMGEMMILYEAVRDASGRIVDFRILDVNQAFTTVTGRTRDNAIGARLSDLLDDPIAGYGEIAEAMLKDGRPRTVELTSARTGRYFQVSAYVTGEKDQIVTLATDVTPTRLREAETLRYARMYAVVSQVSQSVVRAKTREDLLDRTCRALIEQGGFAASWAGCLRVSEDRLVRVASWGDGRALFEELGSLHDGWEAGPGRKAFEDGRPTSMAGLGEDPAARPWGPPAAARGYRSAAAIPLREDGQLIGAVSVYARESGAFSATEMSLLGTIADDLGYAFDKMHGDAVRSQALANLTDSERRFRALFEQAPVAYQALDSRGVIVDMNPAWLSLFGLFRGDVVGRPFLDFVSSAEQTPFLQGYSALVAHGGERTFDLELVRDDGRRFSSQVAVRVQGGADGGFRMAHCVVYDITERKRFERALQEGEERLEAAFELANDGIWEVNLRTGETLLSHRYHTMLGYAPGEIPAGPDAWLAMVHPDDAPEVAGRYKAFLEGADDRCESEYRMRDKAGEWRWILSRGRVVEKGPVGEKLRIVGTNSDITERKRAEAELVETARRYRSYVDDSPIAILVVDGDGVVREANRAASQLFGYEPSEAGSLTLGRLLEPRGGDQAAQVLGRFRHAERVHGEFKGERRNGSEMHLLLQGVTTQPGRHLLFCQDLTARRAAEQGLLLREAMFESILHTSMDGYCTLDVEGRILEANEHFASLMGCSLKEVLQMRLSDFDAVESSAVLRQHLDRIVRHGADRWETCYRSKSGGLVDVEIGATFVPTEGGRLVVFLRDISERKRSELALRQSQKRLALIIEGSALAAWDWNLVSGDVTFNAYWSRMTGRGEGESTLAASSWREMIHPADVGEVDSAFEEHLKGRKPYFECEYRLRRSGGGWLWVYDRGQVIARDTSGRPMRATGTQRDITDRRDAEQRVREQAALLDQTRDIVLTASPDGVVRFANRGAQLFFGLKAQDFDRRPLLELLDGLETPCDQALLSRVLDSGEWHGELRFTGGFHQGRILDARFSVVRLDDDGAQLVLIVCTDITEKQLLESRFLRSQRMESIGSLATGVAHDLNNIFLPITLAANMLRKNPPEDQKASLFAMLDQSAQRGADIVRQLLTFGKGLDGRRVELQPRMLFHEVRRIIRETFPKNITLETRIPEDLWTVSADPTQLHQVLLNLCLNSRDAMRAGGTLTLSAENIIFDDYYAAMNPEAEAGPYIILEVGDTGAGIAPENLEKIFDPFFTTKEPGAGTGLGLSTVHGIVKSHGGFVQVRSQVGQGTLFKVYLPAIPALVEVTEVPAAEDIPAGNGETILVVDDEEAVRETLRHMLESQAYRVIVAADGRQGLVCFRQQQGHIRAVVTDIMMPIMDGEEFLRNVRRLDPHVPVIAMSGLPDKESATTASDRRANAFIMKPFLSEQLLVLLHSKLAEAAARREEGVERA